MIEKFSWSPEILPTLESENKFPTVAYAVWNQKQEILLAKHAHGNGSYGRLPGQNSLPTETAEERDSRVRKLIERGLEEELGINLEDKILTLLSLQAFAFIPRKKIRPELLLCAEFSYSGDPYLNPNSIFQARDGEILSFSWFSPTEYIPDAEIETRRLIGVLYRQRESNPRFSG